jgi:hypothetical protein
MALSAQLSVASSQPEIFVMAWRLINMYQLSSSQYDNVSASISAYNSWRSVNIYNGGESGESLHQPAWQPVAC